MFTKIKIIKLDVHMFYCRLSDLKIKHCETYGYLCLNN